MTLRRAGLHNEADFDLWTAVLAGLASQQLANEPGGDRYLRLIDETVTMFADHILGPGRAHDPAAPDPQPAPDS